MDKYLADNGLVDAGEFDDVGSGLSTDHRPGFLEMIAKALDPANDIGHIVFPDLSRYSRSKVDPHIYLAMLDEADITVHSVSDGKRSDTDDISWDIQFSLNHKQSRDISFLSLRAYPKIGGNLQGELREGKLGLGLDWGNDES
jgi:DNA invertase Pin-like site-specific DNA recombinase